MRSTFRWSDFDPFMKWTSRVITSLFGVAPSSTLHACMSLKLAPARGMPLGPIQPSGGAWVAPQMKLRSLRPAAAAGPACRRQHAPAMKLRRVNMGKASMLMPGCSRCRKIPPSANFSKAHRDVRSGIRVACAAPDRHMTGPARGGAGGHVRLSPDHDLRDHDRRAEGRARAFRPPAESRRPDLPRRRLLLRLPRLLPVDEPGPEVQRAPVRRA